MYDVLYLDGRMGQRVVASALDRETACQVARDEAHRRGAARMFLAGSASVPRSNAVLIVEASRRAA